MKYVSQGAQISHDGKYRYLLWREWRLHPKPAKWFWWKNEDGSPCVDGANQPIGEPETCLFIMLNPSTADAETDDPTIRRCVGFAADWGYDRVEIVNLFAYRATSPQTLLGLKHGDDPVGERNQDIFGFAARNAHLVVCAWGSHGSYLGQDETTRGWFTREAYCLGRTLKGFPKHPLYLAASTPLEIFS